LDSFQPKVTATGAAVVSVVGMVPVRTDELEKYWVEGVIPEGIGFMFDAYVKLTKLA
jgi:hypothetical protein